jgi:hypothetical protein
VYRQEQRINQGDDGPEGPPLYGIKGWIGGLMYGLRHSPATVKESSLVNRNGMGYRKRYICDKRLPLISTAIELACP